MTTLIEQNNNKKVLCIDDRMDLITAISRNLSYRLPNVSCHGAVSVTKAFKQIQKTNYHLILVDLRLSPQNLTEGIDFIAEIAPKYPNSKFILYTSHPYDQIIQQKIEELNESQPNFPLFIGDKADPKLLSEIAETYFKQQSKIINTTIVSEDLLIQLQEIKNTLWQKEVNRIYEYGELLNTARLAIENRREEIKKELKDLESQKKGQGSPLYKQLTEELEEISQLWSRWIGEKIDLSYRQIAKYVDYYRFFSQPEYHQYRVYIDLETFLLMNQKKNRRQQLFSDEELKYLLERAEEESLDLKRMKQVNKLKKASPTLPIAANYVIAAEDTKIISYLIESIQSQSQSITSVKEIEALLKKSRNLQTQQLFKALLPSTEEEISIAPSAQWQKKQHYCLFKGPWQDAIAQLPSNLEIEAVIFEQKIADPTIVGELIGNNTQITTLKEKDWENFTSLFEEHIYRVGATLPEPKIMIIQVIEEHLPKIQTLIAAWQEAQTNAQFPPEDQAYFSEMLQNLSDRHKLWLIGS